MSSRERRRTFLQGDRTVTTHAHWPPQSYPREAQVLVFAFELSFAVQKTRPRLLAWTQLYTRNRETESKGSQPPDTDGV